MYAIWVSRRRQQRRAERARRHVPPPGPTELAERSKEPARPSEPPVAADPRRVVLSEAGHVERLAYTRSQAAAALGVSRSTFIRRVLPCVETFEMPWGARLIPVDELERLLAERRRAAKQRAVPVARGRPAVVRVEVVRRIRVEHAAGRSLGQIARGLDADGIPTAHEGARWWPSTVRAVLRRAGS